MGATTIAPAPQEQRMQALARANEIRTRRARLKRDLKAGRTSIEEVLLGPPDCLRTATILDLLIWTPKYKRVKATKLLRRCGISPVRAVGALTDRQRRLLVSELQTRAVT